MLQKVRRYWLPAIGMAVFLGACATFTTMYSPHASRGLKFPHKHHADQGLGCVDCHVNDEKGVPGMPKHELCLTCHDFDEKNPDPAKCAQCHLRKDWSVTPIPKLLNQEVIFVHAQHTDKQVECATCHVDLDKEMLPAKNLMKWCMDCHSKTKASLTECRVCHSTLDKTVKPTYRHGMRLPHDNPLMWETLHGRESQRDKAFCEICHDKESSCEDCHRKNPPKSHNIAWRNHTHGMRASWDRQKCAACHEEDSCIQCHKKTKPRSHRSGWSGLLNRHCVECHYPPSDTGCTVCHENIEHPKALASPHNVGLYGQCNLCHPGGSPYRAPHIMNPSVKCLACH